MATTMTGRLLTAAMTVLAVLAVPSPAWADPPGPTDFQSEIVRIEPPNDAVEASIIGGDAFFALEVERGVSVTIAGYQGEPFLEFLPSGEVRENRNSPSYHLSKSKLGAPVPPGVDADSPPEWVVVASDGSYAWHDHRSHFMGSEPSGARGDVVWEAVVPLVVDGVPVDVHVATTWLEPAAPWPAVLGGLIGAGVAATYVAFRRRRTALALPAAAAGAALAVGLTQFASVPAVTAPSPLAWVLPATAAIAIVLAGWLAGRPASDVFAVGALALGGVELVIWTWIRRSGLTAAILPTDAPFWLDRAITAGVGVVGLVVAALTVGRLVEMVTRPAAASATAPRPDRT